MVPIETFQIISLVLLVVAILSTYFANSKSGGDGERSYDAIEVVKLPKMVDLLWLVTTLILPFVFVIILVAVPDIIYGKIGTVMFQGDIIVQILGLMIASFGLILLIWSGRTLGMFDIGDIALDRDHLLIDTGPYARIRHPGYTANVLLNFALVLYSLNLLFLINFFIVVALSVYRAQLEEQLLASEIGFGEQYKEYMKRTGRFLPSL